MSQFLQRALHGDRSGPVPAAPPSNQQDNSQIMLENFGQATLADLCGDWVVYRSLEPLDKRVAGFKSAAYRMGISEERIPRKQERDYAKAAVWIVEEAQRVRGAKRPVAELLFVGDTLFNDGQAYQNMVAESGWRGSCFIGADRAKEEAKVTIDGQANLYNANRWAALAGWLAWLREQGMHLDERTAVVIDIDKTALGAKGRNDHVIDRARLEGIFRTMAAVLGEAFDRETFVAHYSELNRSHYHFLTEDNQDYLAYICLVLNTGLVSFDELKNEIETNSMKNFDQFIRWVDSRMMLNDTGSLTLVEVHQAVLGSVRAGDPTPFKRFRRQEFVCTVEHMGQLDDGAPVEELIEREIALTEEVYQAAEWLKQRGCFVLCLSDKPDEASRPTGRDPSQPSPIHRQPTHRIGNDIRPALAALA